MTPDNCKAQFHEEGWLKCGTDPVLLQWLTHAIPAARAAVADPANAHWMRCQGTWFAGVNVLANDASGAVNGSGPLRGAIVETAAALGLPVQAWDRGQVSVIYPGYPKPRTGESDAAYRYRRDRDAAHVDGLHPVGDQRRRILSEPHAFVLGLPLGEAAADASPLVLWQGSHHIMRRALGAVLQDQPVERWGEVDLTEAYHAGRREVFETCARMCLHAGPGEAYLVHRLALHGVAPWTAGDDAPGEARMIAYFRPELPGPISDWIALP
ncbi:MAG: hypothetical protein LJE68_10815 [Rhodobacter sp.]|nr:hypothetical protein [Rhodobacter sp.]